MSVREVIAWVEAAEKLPDNDRTLLVRSVDESEVVWLGWHDADGWFYSDGVSIEEGVKRWAELPTGEATQ